MSASPEPRLPAEVLEENLEWIRSLARSLVRNAHAADELAQDACVVALEGGPREARSFRPWLASVMRNLVRQRVRGEARREAREHEAGWARSASRSDAHALSSGDVARGFDVGSRSSHDAARSPDDLVERVLVFRELAQHVLELEEPYRSAILMRFFEGLPPRAIARRLGTTPATIQNRITRGLALLRERLDRERGGREAWLSALVPCLGRPETLTALSVGGILVNAKLIVGFVLVAAAGTIVALTRIEGGTEKTVDARAGATHMESASIPTALAEEPRAIGAGAGMERELAATNARPLPASTASAPGVGMHKVRGRVLDAAGQPLSGIALRLGEASLALRVDEKGELVEQGGGTEKGAPREGDAVRPMSASEHSGSAQSGPGDLATEGDAASISATTKDAAEKSASARSAAASSTARPGSASRTNHDGGDKSAIIARSTGGGWFEFTTAQDSLQIFCADPLWTSVRSAEWRSGMQLEPLLVVARATDASGIVQDARGNLLAGARVRFVMPDGFETRFDRPLEASVERGWGTTSDQDGHFALAGLPAIEGARLVALLEGFAPGECAAPLVPDSGISLVLARPKQPLAGGLRGRVVDERGSPVAGARVFLGLASTTSDEEGHFALDFARAVSTDRLVALKAGWRMALLDRPREPHGVESGWPASVELAFPGPVLTLRGEVLDAHGKPVPGLRVSLASPTLVGRIGQMPVHAEFLAAGGVVPPQALESENSMPERDGERFNDMMMPVGPATAFYGYVTTDAEGRFELGGLEDKSYRLTLQDKKTCSHFVPDEEFRAGAEPVRIEWPAPKLLARVAGVVVGDDDRPVADARLALVREAFGTRARVFGGDVYVSLRDRSDKAKTGADGRFEFHDVPAEGMQLEVAGERIVPNGFRLAQAGDPTALKLVVFQRCSFEIVQTSKDLVVDAIALRDEKDGVLDILRIDVEHTNAYTTAKLVDGRTGVLSASSAARTLVLLQNGVPVKTILIRLRPGEVNRIEI